MSSANGTVTRLAAREVWRGNAAAAVGTALMLEVILSSYSAAFSSGGVGGLRSLVDNPAVRALYGTAYDLNSAGGFGVWRGGTFVLVVAGLWGALASVRVLRGEEEAGRWDLLLAQPVRPRAALDRHLLVLLAGCAVIGAAIAAVFLLNSQAADGAVLFGAGTALLAAAGVGVGACCAQVFGQRRRAAGVAGSVIGAAYLARMLGDASGSLDWLRWLTPFGWVQELRAYGGDHPGPLALLVASAAGLQVAAVAMYGRRDLGAGLVADRGHVGARTRLLGGLLPFAWRERLAAVAGWSAGLAVYGFVIGAITASFTDFIRSNAEFRDFVARYGIGNLRTPAEFIGLMAGVLGLLLVLQVTTSVHRCWEEERDGHLDLLHALPVTRTGWLGAEVAASCGAVACSVAVSILAAWAGAGAGGADLSLVDTARAIVNSLSVVVLFTGLAVALHGLLPRIALAVPAGLAVVAYFLAFLGPAADLPHTIVTLSPFAHLARVPAVPVEVVATTVMVGSGLLLGVLGFVGYARRDLRT
jgi:ABC-2 type transport system permease protein